MTQRSEPERGWRSQPILFHEPFEAAWKSELAGTSVSIWKPNPGFPYLRAFERFSGFYPRLCALPRHFRRRLQRRLGMSLAGVALVLAMSGLPMAMAATITVNTDIPDINTDGKCSLIEAIINANDNAQTHADCVAGSGADIIDLPPGSVHTLTAPYAGGSSGLPVINTGITIEGNGSTIRRDANAPEFRILETIRGDWPDYANLTINDTAISGGISGDGSAIRHGDGSLVLNYSAIIGNTGLAIEIPGGGNDLTLNHSEISNNDGSGICCYSSVTLNNSTISGNSGFGVDGIYGTTELNNSVVKNNGGFGLSRTDGNIRIFNSTISGNRGRGISLNETVATIENSTISENNGGVSVDNYGVLRLVHSTITGNESDDKGGGIHFVEYSASIYRSVISGNAALGGGDEIYNGVDSWYTPYLYLDDHNVLGHSGISSDEAFGAIAGAPLPTPGPTDIVATSDGTDPTALSDILETTLKRNGGWTGTHALVAGSPAIDAAGADCPPPDTDQRGVSRPTGTACDIGAFEVGDAIFKPAEPGQIWPKGTITDSTPMYIWRADNHATRYKLRVDDSSGKSRILKWYTAEAVGCPNGTGTCSLTPAYQVAEGNAQWKVKGGNGDEVDGVGNWSDFLAFKVESDDGGTVKPGPVTLVSPRGTITDNTPTYTWNAEINSDRYKLRVDDSTGDKKILQWYTAAEAGCASDEVTCSLTPSYQVAKGNADWQIRGGNDLGVGPWSDPMAFTVDDGGGTGGKPGPVTLISPSGPITGNLPTYTWNREPDSNRYKLRVDDSTGDKRILSWYTAAEAGCASDEVTCSLTPSYQVAAGNADWQIRGGNDLGVGPWSDPLAFTVEDGGGGGGEPPGKPTLISPNGTITDNTPTYTWNAEERATRYKLRVDDSTGDKKILEWYTADETGCPDGTGICTLTPSYQVAEGDASWKVRGGNGDEVSGVGEWSDFMDFTVESGGTVKPGPVTLVSPTGAISDNTPTYTWNAEANSNRYKLRVDDSTGDKKILEWYTDEETNCPGGTGTCSLTPGFAVASGNADWQIRGGNDLGVGPWSDPMGFSVP